MTITATETTRAELTAGFIELMRQIRGAANCGLPEMAADRLQEVTTHQLEVLALLASPDCHLTMNELARRQGCAMSTATAVVERLCRQGLLERSHDPDDRRVVRVQLTADATDAVACLDARRRQIADHLLTPLDNDELMQLIGLLAKIAPHPEEICG